MTLVVKGEETQKNSECTKNPKVQKGKHNAGHNITNVSTTSFQLCQPKRAYHHCIFVVKLDRSKQTTPRVISCQTCSPSACQQH